MLAHGNYVWESAHYCYISGTAVIKGKYHLHLPNHALNQDDYYFNIISGACLFLLQRFVDLYLRIAAVIIKTHEHTEHKTFSKV